MIGNRMEERFMAFSKAGVVLTYMSVLTQIKKLKSAKGDHSPTTKLV